MTSLTETLPILDEAVPALPAKVKEVAREADALHQALVDAMNAMHAKRDATDALAERLGQALTTLRDQARNAEQQLQGALRETDEAADEAAREIDDAEAGLAAEGADAVAAMGTLQARLVQAGEQTSTAHEEARSTLEALAGGARDTSPELDAAVDRVTAAVGDAEKAIEEGQAQVGQGIAALVAALDRLGNETQQRLARTAQKLDDLRAEQEQVIGTAAAAMETGREKVEQEVSSRLESDVREAVDPELDSVYEALSEMGAQVVQLQVETGSEREGLELEVAELGDRIPPLQGGVDQVRRAAQTLGVEWPA